MNKSMAEVNHQILYDSSFCAIEIFWLSLSPLLEHSVNPLPLR